MLNRFRNLKLICTVIYLSFCLKVASFVGLLPVLAACHIFVVCFALANKDWLIECIMASNSKCFVQQQNLDYWLKCKNWSSAKKSGMMVHTENWYWGSRQNTIRYHAACIITTVPVALLFTVKCEMARLFVIMLNTFHCHMNWHDSILE